MKGLLPQSLRNALERSIHGRYGLILTYHSVVGIELDFDLWPHMASDLFEQHVAAIARCAEIVPLAQMIDEVRSGYPGRHRVALTFDDGFRNNLTRALPVLRKYDAPATVFLATDLIGSDELFWPERVSYQIMRTRRPTLSLPELGELSLEDPAARRHAFRAFVRNIKKSEQPELLAAVRQLEQQLQAPYDPEDPLYQEFRPLSWQEVRDMDAEGLVSFGGHTASHAILSRLTEEESAAEIAQCRRALDEHLPRPVGIWAYPNGSRHDYAPLHRRQLEEAGFRDGILTMESEFVSTGSDPQDLGRFGIAGGMSVPDLDNLLSKRSRRYEVSTMQQVGLVARGLFDTLRDRTRS